MKKIREISIDEKNQRDEDYNFFLLGSNPTAINKSVDTRKQKSNSHQSICGVTEYKEIETYNHQNEETETLELWSSNLRQRTPGKGRQD